MYAFVATSKYGDHLPLHRISNILKRQGAHVSKQSMWDLMARLDELVAQPVLREMHRQLLEEPVLQADETPVTLLREGEKGSKGSSRGYLYAQPARQSGREGALRVPSRSLRARA